MTRRIGNSTRSLSAFLSMRRPGALDRARSALTVCISPGCWGPIVALDDESGEPLDHLGSCGRCGLRYRRRGWSDGWTEVLGPVEVALDSSNSRDDGERRICADLVVVHGCEFAVAYANESAPRLVRLTEVLWVRHHRADSPSPC